MKFLILYVFLTIVTADGFVVKYEPRKHYPVLSRNLPTSESYTDFLYWLALYKRKLQRFGFYPIVDGEGLWRTGKSATGFGAEIADNLGESRESAEFVDSAGQIINANNLPAYTVFQENGDESSGNPAKNNYDFDNDMIAEVIVENLEDIPDTDSNSNQIQFNILPATDASPNDEIYDFVSYDEDLSVGLKKSNDLANIAQIIEEMKDSSQEEYADPLDNLVALEAAGILPFVVARDQDDFVPDMAVDLEGSDEDQSGEETLFEILDKASRIPSHASIQPSVGEESESSEVSSIEKPTSQIDENDFPETEPKEILPPTEISESQDEDAMSSKTKETESIAESNGNIEETKQEITSPTEILEKIDVDNLKIPETDPTDYTDESVGNIDETKATEDSISNPVLESTIELSESALVPSDIESFQAPDASTDREMNVEIAKEADNENESVHQITVNAEGFSNVEKTSDNLQTEDKEHQTTPEYEEKVAEIHPSSVSAPDASTDGEIGVELTKDTDQQQGDVVPDISVNPEVPMGELSKTGEETGNNEEVEEHQPTPGSKEKVAQAHLSSVSTSNQSDETHNQQLQPMTVRDPALSTPESDAEVLNSVSTSNEPAETRNDENKAGWEPTIDDSTLDAMEPDPIDGQNSASSPINDFHKTATIKDSRKADQHVDALSISPQELLDFMVNADDEIDDNRTVPKNDHKSPSNSESTEKTSSSPSKTETTDSVLMSPEELFEFMENTETESSEDRGETTARTESQNSPVVDEVQPLGETSQANNPTSEFQHKTVDLSASSAQENLDGPIKSLESIQSTIQVLDNLSDETLSLLISPEEKKKYSENSAESPVSAVQAAVIDVDNATLELVRDTSQTNGAPKTTNPILDNSNDDMDAQMIPPYILPSPDVRRTKLTEANEADELDTTTWRETLVGSNKPDDISESMPGEKQSNVQLEVLDEVLSMTQDSFESSSVKKRILNVSKDFDNTADQGPSVELENIERAKKNLTISAEPIRETDNDWTIRGTGEQVVMTETAKNVLEDKVVDLMEESHKLNEAVSPVIPTEEEDQLKNTHTSANAENNAEEVPRISQISNPQKPNPSPVDTLDGDDNSGEYNPLPIGEYILRLNSTTSIKNTEVATDEAEQILPNRTRGRKYDRYAPFDLLNANEKAFDIFNTNDDADDSEEEEEMARPTRRNLGRSDIPIEEEYPDDYEY